MPNSTNGKTVDHAKVKDLVKELLVALGEDPEREGLKETPRRIANFWRDFIEYDAGKLDTTFAAVKHNQMVAVTGMRVWSMCEHHMLPFWCDISIAYIAEDKVLGLSKFARIAHKHAHKLTLQEQLVSDISEDLKEILGTDDVAVMAKGEHLCMTMRGIRTPAPHDKLCAGRSISQSRATHGVFAFGGLGRFVANLACYSPETAELDKG